MSDDVGLTTSDYDDDDDDGCLFWKESVAVKKCAWKMTFQWHPSMSAAVSTTREWWMATERFFSPLP